MSQFGNLKDGRQTVASSASATSLVSASTPASWVTVTAETDNTGIISVGGSTVVAALATRRGVPLSAGQGKTLLITDLSRVWIGTTVDGDGVTYVYGD